MTSEQPILRPVIDDPDTAAFFAAAADGRLVVQSCERCGAIIHLPTGFCADCARPTTHWVEVDGRATVHSWTVVEHQTHPAFPVPYTSVLVELLEPAGVRFLARLAGRPELAVGMPMVVEFVDVGGVRIPNWVPTAEEEK